MSNVPFRGGDVVEDETGYRYVIFEQSWSVLSIDRANRNPGPPLTLVGRAMPDATNPPGVPEVADPSNLLAHRLGLIHEVICSEDTGEEAFATIRAIMLGQCDHLPRMVK